MLLLPAEILGGSSYLHTAVSPNSQTIPLWKAHFMAPSASSAVEYTFFLGYLYFFLPTWQANFMAPSGSSAVEYKYVILRGDSVLWEADIQNRMFTAEGAVLDLDDGRFNVEAVLYTSMYVHIHTH
jgi:hypothetical protein